MSQHYFSTTQAYQRDHMEQVAINEALDYLNALETYWDERRTRHTSSTTGRTDLIALEHDAHAKLIDLRNELVNRRLSLDNA